MQGEGLPSSPEPWLDTASGQQALFASPGTTRRTRPAGAARILHRLITGLTMPVTATTVTKRRAPDGASQTSALSGEGRPERG
jgi:hypothetical protein